MDESTIAYPAGSNLILLNIENKSQRFIHVSENSVIRGIAMSPNRKYVAVSEKGDRATIAIYDAATMRRRKVLSLGEAESKEFVSMCFSPDSKMIITQTGAPDWVMQLWNWEKSKIVTTLKTNVLQNNSIVRDPTVSNVSSNPTDQSLVCVTGNGIFKLLRYGEGGYKILSIPKLDTKNIMGHCWADDRVVLCTDDGKLYAADHNGEIKWESAVVHPTTQKPRIIAAISAFSKGFIIGCSGGLVCVFEKIDEMGTGGMQAAARVINDQASISKDGYKKVRDIYVTDDQTTINNITLAPNEDSLLFTSENCQMYFCAVSNSEKTEEVKLDPFGSPSHHAAITGMDTCVRKPLIVTCSTDRSVRVWNYLEGQSELVKYFPEEAYSAAIHPSGLYILVGFSDKLRLMNLLIDDIRSFREFTIRGCRECRFSNGGQYFAAVHANTVVIYSSWTFESLGSLKGHNSKVRAIHWNADDSRIVTAGYDGAVYDWSLKDLSGFNGIGIKREGESVLKSCSYNSVCTSADEKQIYAVGNDKTLKEIHDSAITKEIPFRCILNQIIISHSGKMMFAGTSTGSIVAFKYPFGEDVGACQEHQAHSSAVTRLRTSHDDQFLFSTAEDGCLYIFRIQDREGRVVKRERDTIYADEILVTKSDLEEKNSLMAELKTRVEELKMENEYQLRLKDMNFNEKIKEVSQKFAQEIEALKITGTVLRTDKGKEEMRHEEEMMEEKEKYSKDSQELETIQNSKLLSEYEKYRELQARTTQLQAQWESQMKDMHKSKELALEDLAKHFDIRLEERQAEIDSVCNF